MLEIKPKFQFKKKKFSTSLQATNSTSSGVPVARRADLWDSKQQRAKRKRNKGKKDKHNFDTYEPPVKVHFELTNL